jgi:hypothetical protein
MMPFVVAEHFGSFKLRLRGFIHHGERFVPTFHSNVLFPFSQKLKLVKRNGEIYMKMQICTFPPLSHHLFQSAAVIQK